jgi:hypothetical protein
MYRALIMGANALHGALCVVVPVDGQTDDEQTSRSSDGRTMDRRR